MRLISTIANALCILFFFTQLSNFSASRVLALSIPDASSAAQGFPPSISTRDVSLFRRDEDEEDHIDPVRGDQDSFDNMELEEDPRARLEKRRGGGGRGFSGARSGGSSSSRGGSPPPYSASSNAGGRTITGSGTPKTFGSGRSRSYFGGSAVPFTSSQKSPSGITPFLMSLALLAFFPGLWLYSVYAYPYSRDIDYFNRTSNTNETLPVLCLCQEYSVCGCDENHNQTYIDELVQNATASVNDTDGIYTSRIADVNGTRTLVINATLENGTTAEGGTEAVSWAGRSVALEMLGMWVVAGAVGLMVWAV